MAARDRWTMEIRCPACGRVDHAAVSEDDYAFMRHPNFSVDCMPQSFELLRSAEYRHETEVKCVSYGRRSICDAVSADCALFWFLDKTCVCQLETRKGTNPSVAER